ncbi:reverse transcriptase domain-containing protein [Tanacetum coccineum]
MDDEPSGLSTVLSLQLPVPQSLFLKPKTSLPLKPILPPPPALFDRLLREIRAFSQHENESLTNAWLRMKEMLQNCHGHNLSKGNIIKIFYHGLSEITQEVLNAAAGGSSNSDTDKIMARIDAMTMKMDAQYKELQSHAKQPTPDLNEDDIPMSYDEEAKFMQTFPKNHQASIQNLETKFDKLTDKQSGRPSGSLPSNTQPNPRGSIGYQPPDDETINLHHNQNQLTKAVKETLLTKPYKPKIPYPQRLRKEKIEAHYGKFLNMIRTVRINVPLVDVLAEMPNYEKFLKELISNKHKIEQISAAFLSDESSAMIQNKVSPKHGDPESFLIPCNFNKTFSCNALADLGASIYLMPYSLYAKLCLKTLKPTKMSVRLADRSFQYPFGIVENMLIEVGKFTFPADFVILEMEEDNKVPLILGRPFLHTADAVIPVKQKQLNLGVGTERMIFNIDSTMKHSYSNDDTCFSINVIDDILEEYFDALLDEGSKILYSIEGTLLEEEIFSEFDEFIAMTAD